MNHAKISPIFSNKKGSTKKTTCSDTCSSSGTYDLTSTCGRICRAAAANSIGATGTCYTNSTYCPGGTYTITQNTYSSVNFDCNSGYGCNAYGGCCTHFGPNSDIWCIKCS
ncbi:unnamed protein product [Adineta steineri]|uniref:Uncharacterized protein n=1 Tax=Adineta steineri TaxID=433720 RepID=A0A813Z227_9BILA|nr:unnamed protein product [Adineta steineri]